MGDTSIALSLLLFFLGVAALLTYLSWRKGGTGRERLFARIGLLNCAILIVVLALESSSDIRVKAAVLAGAAAAGASAGLVSPGHTALSKRKSRKVRLAAGLSFAGILLVVLGAAHIVSRKLTDSRPAIVDFDPRKHSGPLGEVLFPYKGESTLCLEDAARNRGIRITTNDGVFRLPPGKFRFWIYTVCASAPDGRTWFATHVSNEKPEVLLAAGESVVFDVGPPLLARIAAKPTRDGTAQLTLETVDGKGRQFTLSSRGPTYEPPGFEVLSAGGAVLWRAKFWKG